MTGFKISLKIVHFFRSSNRTKFVNFKTGSLTGPGRTRWTRCKVRTVRNGNLTIGLIESRFTATVASDMLSRSPS